VKVSCTSHDALLERSQRFGYLEGRSRHPGVSVKKAEGVILIIKQLAEFVQKTETNVKLCIAGGGDHHRDISDYLEYATLPSGLIVELLGYVDDMDAINKKADIFCLPL
jgi:glycosyltransferase involved in cell wall biosynthesis